MLWERYTERARKVILQAEDWAIRLNTPYISPEHILLGLLENEDPLTLQILERLGVNIQRLKAELESQLRAQAPAQRFVGSPTLTSSAKQVLIHAADEVRSMGSSHIDTVHLLLGLLKEKQGLAAKLLAQFRVHYEDVQRIVFELKETGKAIPTLEKFAEDWTQKAIAGEFRPVNFWQKERTQFIVSLMRKERPNLLLLGNLKTAVLLVQQLACELVQKATQVPERKLPTLLLRLKWDALQSEEAMFKFLDKIRPLEPKPVLFVGTIDEIAKWSSLLIAVIQQRVFPTLVIATLEQWNEFQHRYPSLAVTFAVIPISEPDEKQTLEWLKAHAEVYSRFCNVTVDESALPAILQLAKERFAEKPLLVTAKSLLNLVCVFALLVKLPKSNVTVETVSQFAELLYDIMLHMDDIINFLRDSR